jgi:hypothetical protein
MAIIESNRAKALREMQGIASVSTPAAGGDINQLMPGAHALDLVRRIYDEVGEEFEPVGKGDGDKLNTTEEEGKQGRGCRKGAEAQGEDGGDQSFTLGATRALQPNAREPCFQVKRRAPHACLSIVARVLGLSNAFVVDEEARR